METQRLHIFIVCWISKIAQHQKLGDLVPENHDLLFCPTIQMIQMRLHCPLYDGEYNPDEYIAKSAPFLAGSCPTIWRAKAPQTDWRQKTSQTASIIQSSRGPQFWHCNIAGQWRFCVTNMRLVGRNWWMRKISQLPPLPKYRGGYQLRGHFSQPINLENFCAHYVSWTYFSFTPIF